MWGKLTSQGLESGGWLEAASGRLTTRRGLADFDLVLVFWSEGIKEKERKHHPLTPH